MTPDREMSMLTSRPRKVGETFDLIDLDDWVQTYIVTAVNPSNSDVAGWFEESNAIGEHRPMRQWEKFWWFWSPWKPWCWARAIRARLFM